MTTEKPLRVMILMEQAAQLVPLANLLTASAYQVEMRDAHDCSDERLAAFQPHAIVFDMTLAPETKMPHLRRIRSICPSAKCLACFPAELSHETLELVVQEGVYASVHAPSDEQEFFLIVRRCLENIRLEQEYDMLQQNLLQAKAELHQIDSRLKAVVSATQNLAACSNLEELGQQLLEEFAIQMAAEGGSLYLKHSDRFTLLHAIDPGHAPQEIVFPLRPESILGKVVESKHPVLIRNIEAETRMNASGWSGYRDGSLLVFPLLDEHGDMLAVLTLHNKAFPPFTEEDLNIGLILVRYSYEVLRSAFANQQLRINEERYRSIFENIRDVYYETTIRGEIVEVSPSIRNHSSYTRDELLGTPVERYYAYPEEHARVFAQLMAKGEVSDYEFYLRDKDGQTAPWSMTAELLRDRAGQPWKICGTLRNISARKQMENELRELNEELERWVDVRTAELQQRNQELQETLEALRKAQHQLARSEKMAMLGSLVAEITHEINTPIGVAITAASHLDEETRVIQRQYHAREMTRSALEYYFEQAQRINDSLQANLRRAADQLQSFKQMAVDQTGEKRRAFRICECIQEVLLSLSPKLKRTPYRITAQCPETIELRSYPGAFSQIFTNLIMNSLIHGFEHRSEGEIVIEAATENDWLCIRYSDTGKGMNADQLARVFEPFYTTKAEQGGSGLGLAIVRHLVGEQLRGEITCESQPEQGTTFRIRVPLVLPADGGQ